jgi:DNA replication protein DnaC
MQIQKHKKQLFKLRDTLLNSCTKCNHSGWINDVQCECSKKFEYYVKLDAAGIDKEYWLLDFDAFIGDGVAKGLVEKYIANLDVAYDEGLGLVLWGGNGLGKTLLSSIILKRALSANKTIQFTTMAELLEIMRDKISNDDAKKFYEEQIKNVDFLCLDNMGSEYAPAKSTGQFSVAEFDILSRYRRRNALPTILTTNENPESFRKLYGNSISSLFSGNSLFIEVTGVDYRKSHNRYSEFIH